MITICTRCHDKIEASNGHRICYACYLDSLLPSDYKRREGYVFYDDLGHANATKHPRTGVPILDESRETLQDAAMRLTGRTRMV